MKPLNRQNGQLLVEILIALALFAAISLIIGQSLASGLLAEREGHEKDLARSIASADIERVRAKADNEWSMLVPFVDTGSTTIASDGAIYSGASTTIADGITFTKTFTITSLARDISATSGDMLLVGVATSSNIVNDRGSLLVRSYVSWGQKPGVVIDTIISRWRNIVCGQNDWSATSTSLRDCEVERAGIASTSHMEVGKELKLCLGC
jgi:type II secretory pathway pseudopilin PulG